MSAWFGESWGAPCCEPGSHRKTPTHQKCSQCGEPIEEGDQGMLLPLYAGTGGLEAFHLKCFLGNVLGPGFMTIPKLGQEELK